MTWHTYSIEDSEFDELLEEHPDFSIYSIVQGGIIGLGILKNRTYQCKIVDIVDQMDCDSVWDSLFQEALIIGKGESPGQLSLF